MFKLIRIGGVSARELKKAKRFLNTNGFKYVLIICAAAILIGAFAMMLLEDMSFQDSLWWSFVTATTVGYGDLSPATNAGRIVTALLMLVGIGLIGSLTSSITSYFLKDDSQEMNSEKVDMVLTLYEKLSDSEKKGFLASIGQSPNHNVFIIETKAENFEEQF